MTLESERIRKIYSGVSAKHYDLPISHFFGKYKKLAFDNSSLKKGDNVLVFCCGTGLDFPYILKIIGKEGRIVGIDFSSEMLQIAKNRIVKKKWENIELVEADVTKYKSEREFDIGICTLGISIIPAYIDAYNNLLSQIKSGGEIIIGDMQLASGWQARLNPLTIFLARRYGGSTNGHQNCVDLCDTMEMELINTSKREFFFKSYFFCIGQKN